MPGPDCRLRCGAAAQPQFGAEPAAGHPGAALCFPQPCFCGAARRGVFLCEPGSRDLYFRVSGANFDWLPQIRSFAEAHAAEADTVTVLWDQESTGHNEYLADEAGRTLDHTPCKKLCSDRIFFQPQ